MRVKSISSVIGTKSDASTSNINNTQVISIGERSQNELIRSNTVLVKESSLSPKNGVDASFHLFEQERKKMIQIEVNASHLKKQFKPLQCENTELKDHIQAYHHYMEVQRKNLAELILDVSAQGEDRTLLKKISNFETLIQFLQMDLMSSNLTQNRFMMNLQEQKALIQRLEQEKQNAYDDIRAEFKHKKEQLKKQLNDILEANKIKDLEIQGLEAKLKDENEKILRTQNLFKEEFKKLNDVILQQQNKLQEQNINYLELQKQTEEQITHLRLDFTQQQTMLSDQYEFSLGELRFAYEVRMDKINQDADNKIREALQEKDRYARDLEVIQRDFKMLTKTREQQDKSIELLTSQVSQLIIQAHGFKDQIQLLQHNLMQARKAVDSSNISAEQLQGQVQDLEKEKQALINELDELTQNNNAKELLIQNLYKEQAYFQESIQQMKQNYDTRIVQLQRQVTTGSAFKSGQLSEQKSSNLHLLRSDNQKGSVSPLKDKTLEQVHEIVQSFFYYKTQSLEKLVNNEEDMILTDRSSELMHQSKRYGSQGNFCQQSQENKIDANSSQINLINLDVSPIHVNEEQKRKQEIQNQRKEKKLKKKQEKIDHLKKELKKAKALLHHQKDKIQKVNEKITAKLHQEQIKRIDEAEKFYQEQIELLRSSYKNLDLSYKHTVVEFHQQIQSDQEQIQHLKTENSQVEGLLIDERLMNRNILERFKKEVDRIKFETQQRIRQFQLLQQVYEKQIEGYHQKYEYLQLLADEVVDENLKTKATNVELTQEIENLKSQLSYEKQETQKLGDNQKKEINSIKIGHDAQIKQQMVQIDFLKDELSRQEFMFRKKMEELKTLMESMAQENDALAEIIFRNDEKIKRYHELKNQFSSISEKCSKMQESLSKASEIIKYMNKEMENYKQTYSMFVPVQTNKASSQQTSPRRVVENRIQQNKILQIKQMKQRQLVKDAQLPFLPNLDDQTDLQRQVINLTEKLYDTESKTKQIRKRSVQQILSSRNNKSMFN